MPRLVTERIKELRKEIDGIRAANAANLRAWDTPTTKRSQHSKRLATRIRNNWFRWCLPVGIKLNLNDQFLFSGSWRILPLLNRLHGGLSEDRTAAQQLGTLDCSAWLNHNFDAHDSPDIEPL